MLSLSRCGSQGHNTSDKAILKHIILQFPLPVVLPDSTKPSVAPKPRFVCHASLKLPSPVMSTAKGPKPSIAPKPVVTAELNERGRANGTVLTSDAEADEEQENGMNRLMTPEEQFTTYIFSAAQNYTEKVSQGLENGEMAGEEKEEDVSQKMDEDWRLTDSALTEEVDSLETPWVSEVGLAADSEEAVEMTDMDMTEDMDAEGCDAGEGLADTDGLSMGDISVNSLDEEGGCYSPENHDIIEKQGSLRLPELDTCDCTAEDLKKYRPENPGVHIHENTNDTVTRGFLGDEDAKEEDRSITCNILGCKEKKTNINNNDFIPEDLKCFCDALDDALEEEPANESYYVSSGDIIKGQMISSNTKAHRPPQSPQTLHRLLIANNSGITAGKYDQMENEQITSVSSENYKKIGNSSYSSDENKACVSFRSDEQEVRTAESSDCQPRYRLVSISVPTDADTSLTSSLSESQLFSPNSSDDLDGHIVPFLDDTTDTEQDISDEHVYEEPGHSLMAENAFPFDRKVVGTHSRSLVRCINNNVAEMGGQFVHRPYVSGFGQPALSSSPMLSSTRGKSNSKPHYLSLYPRSLSVEGQDPPLCVYRDREGSARQGAICSSGSFSRCSPLSSGLSTPTSVVDIPPPFELAYITKKPITKSSPSLLIDGDSSDKHRKKKSSIKRFLMLKFKWKTEKQPVVDVNPSSPKSSHHTASRLLDVDRSSVSNSPRLNSHSASKCHLSSEPSPNFLFYKESKRKGNAVAFLNRSVVRVESFEDRSRVPFTPLPLTKPRSISFPNADTSDYENVPAISSDYENLQVPQRRPVRQVPFPNYFDRPSRMLSSANETDGYVDMSSLPGFEIKTKSPQQEAER